MRHEDELARGGRIRGQPAALIVDEQAAVEAFPEVDAAAGVGAAVRAARELDQAAAESHGVVAGDAAGVPAAQPVREIAGGPAPGGGGGGRGLSEAPVVVSEVGREEGLGRRDGLDGAEAELGDEPILQGGPEALDAAFGLGGVGGDVADREVPQDGPEVRGVLRPLKLLLEAPVGVIADEDAEAIAVEGHWQPGLGGEAAQQGEIAVEVLGRAEVQGQDGARRIVDGAQEEQGRAGAEPVERAAIDEDETAEGGMARAAGAVLGWAAPALGGQALRPPQPADGAPTDGQALTLPELLGAVAVIEVPIRGLDQRSHAVPDLDGQGSGREAATQPVDQAADARRLIARFEATDLPDAEAKGLGHVGIGELTGEGRLDQAGPGGLLPTHHDGLPCLHGRTFLQNS